MSNFKKGLVAVGLSAACMFVFSQTALAQTAERQLMVVNQLQIKPEMRETFRDLHKDIFMPAGRAGGLAWRYTGSTVYGDTLQMNVVTPIDNFAALDAEPMFGATQNEARLAQGVWASSVISRTRFILSSRPDLSMEARPSAGLVSTYRIVVKPGKAAEFEALWNEKMLPAAQQADIEGTQVFQVVNGGNNSEYLIRTPLANFAAMDAGGPLRALSPRDAARLNAEVGELVSEMEISVVRTDGELSYGLPGLQP